MATLVHSVEYPELPPLRMPDRFRHDITYFMTIGGEPGVPTLGAGEYWINLDDARRWLDDGVISVVSPLDSENKTDVELSEEQEEWLSWMVTHRVQHVRLG
jgi:hypothetical protein